MSISPEGDDQSTSAKPVTPAVPSVLAYQQVSTPASLGTYPPVDPAIEAEIVRIQNRKVSPAQMVLLLALSLFLFYVLRNSSDNSISTIVCLILILLIHELGHFITMRIFHYRNVSMFFIPLFGAVVTGQNYNISGWKKSVVALMGPIPGLILCIPLGILGIVIHSPLLINASFLCCFLNGMNLLPLHPLDGGQNVRILLTSRHYVFDAIFRVGAAILLILLFISISSNIAVTIGLSVGILMNIPAGLIQGKVTQKLRQVNLPPAPNEVQEIPPEMMRAIVHEVQTAMPKAKSAKAIATHTLAIYENLNAQSPTIPISLLLLGIQAGAVVVAIVFTIIFAIAAHPDALKNRHKTAWSSHQVKQPVATTQSGTVDVP